MEKEMEIIILITMTTVMLIVFGVDTVRKRRDYLAGE